MRFVWGPIKAKSNIKKHKVSFEEAATVFLDQEQEKPIKKSLALI